MTQPFTWPDKIHIGEWPAAPTFAEAPAHDPFARSNRPLIYVAGPLTGGMVAANIRNAIAAGERIWLLGGVPFVPHLSFFWNMISFHQDTKHIDEQGKLAFWVEYDFAILEKCDALFRLPGESTGADLEEKFCHAHGIPIYTDYNLLKDELLT